MFRSAAVFFSCLFPFLLSSEEAKTPETPVDLLSPPLAETFVQHLNEKASLSSDFDAVWTKNATGNLQVTGKGLGYLRSKTTYQDYHLVCEYRWSERTFAGRADRARDGGVLLHITGEDGAFHGTWPACLQAQLIEGGSGDMIALPTKATSSRFNSTASLQDLPIWTPDGEKVTLPLEGKSVAHLGWRNRSENWKDVKGFRGELDVENPPGNWNRLEVIAKGDNLTYWLNGEKVNEATGVFPNSGAIGLQTEFAAYEIRRLEVHPLDTFQEKWSEEIAAIDMGYSISGESLLPRERPLSPEESRRLWEIHGDFEIELVASEPLTCDPVDVVWDAKGRMFVAEMGDYPLPVDDGPFLSRIRLLRDENEDGVMDEAVTWAENLDHVQGLLALRDGILATTRTEILFLRDTDGDDRADERKVLFRSNAPRHNQLQVSSPRWGLDNRIYLCNGLDGKQIYPHGRPEEVTQFSRFNLRYDPFSGTIEPTTGLGQFGGTIDAFGRHFFCSNRSPAMFAVMPLEAVQRNPLAAIGVGHEDIQPPASPVHPIALSHTTSVAHAGTHTSACGLAIYLGNLLPELKGDLFVCDPTGQLVTRNRLERSGASFRAERVGREREFLASADEWTRPVQVRNGPDGALYIVDMYRRFIDHARFFPEEFAKAHYMRAGFDQGRIWKVVPKDGSAPELTSLPDAPEELVALLAHPNEWQRRHAQRLLVEGCASEANPSSETTKALEAMLQKPPSPEAAVRALWTLAGIGTLDEESLAWAHRSSHPAVVENALEAAAFIGASEMFASPIEELPYGSEFPRAQFLSLCLFPDIERSAVSLAEGVLRAPNDSWLRKAILSSEGALAPVILDHLLSPKPLRGLDSLVMRPPETGADAIVDFARHTAALGDLEGLARALTRCQDTREWWHFELVSGIAEGLKRSQLPQKSLTALLAADLPELGNGTVMLSGILESATRIALDRSRSEAERKAAMALLTGRPFAETVSLVENLITIDESPGIQEAACQVLSSHSPEKVADFFFDRWQTLPPIPRREALALITRNPKTGLELMKRMETGEISRSLMPAMNRWTYGRSSNDEIRELAQSLFGSVDPDRAAMISRYTEALTQHPGDADRGREVFLAAACATCHEAGGIGVEVGPSLHDIKAKPIPAILTDILDPNRAVENRWTSTMVTTKSGTAQVGIVFAEDADSVTVRLPGGSEKFIPRLDISEITSSGLSLMPPGLEAALPPQKMADLIAFLKKR